MFSLTTLVAEGGLRLHFSSNFDEFLHECPNCVAIDYVFMKNVKKMAHPF